MAIKILSDCDETLKSEITTCDRLGEEAASIVLESQVNVDTCLDKLSALFYTARAEARKEGRNNGG